ncbi:hypothetical protein DFJ67_5432 [Asanoa ferruginea]|uniref:Alpha/beta hydrolase family protein n=2 Tax=Asanoa ferruginea TaxID=53367 RepID=A0A3D9ZPV0_9ACTN|nr:hypothetical protein DFJ67_5432 [Asanoa ferruginea]GIF46000.1 hypothetical protein Afe04nite_05390 [Asanoa ferruginea]
MLLVHSPLLTPATWEALLPHLEAAGWRVVLLDLRPSIEAPSFHAAVCAAAAATGTAHVVVGHSRAGPYLPGIVEAVGGDVVFLDARLPHPGTSWLGSLPPERARWLREVAVSGRLPRWDTWFPADDLLLTDPARRRALRDLPELPWSVVSEVLPAPGRRWDAAGHTYVQLSAAYQATADEAAQRGWRVHRLDADHLAMVTRPAAVAQLLTGSPAGGS